MRFVWLLLPCVLVLAVSLYNATEPALAGIPLFFWAQLAVVPLSSLCIWLAWRGKRP
jgi:hypothetical protein